MFKRCNPTGVSNCKDRCILCREYLHIGGSVYLKNGQELKPNEWFECTSRNLLYTAICSGCGECYVGETGDQLNNRFTTHRQQSKEGAQIQSVKADQHLRICGKNQYSVFPFRRMKKNCTIYRRVVENHYYKKIKPLLNGKTTFQPS